MSSKTSLSRFVPLAAFVIVLGFLIRGLFLQPRDIPSPRINKTVPQFELTDLIDGKPLSQSVLRGKWTIFNVWASWCEACTAEHAFLLQLHNKGFNLVGLNYKDDPDTARTFLSNYGNPYRIVLSDTHGQVAIDFGVFGSPETFLIDKNGVIRYRYAGILTHDVWQQSFLPLIEGKRS